VFILTLIDKASEVDFNLLDKLLVTLFIVISRSELLVYLVKYM